jgi:hypothetical protein
MVENDNELEHDLGWWRTKRASARHPIAQPGNSHYGLQNAKTVQNLPMLHHSNPQSSNPPSLHHPNPPLLRFSITPTLPQTLIRSGVGVFLPKVLD